jgi:hypothetical protein
MAICPNCDAEIKWDDGECPTCHALFTAVSGWHPIPKAADEDLQIKTLHEKRMPDAVISEASILATIVGLVGLAIMTICFGAYIFGDKSDRWWYLAYNIPIFFFTAILVVILLPPKKKEIHPKKGRSNFPARKQIDIFFSWLVSGLLVTAILNELFTEDVATSLTGIPFWAGAIGGVVHARRYSKRYEADHRKPHNNSDSK